ncbi:hypothetical protein BN1708_003677 [Verticillium longisporum]|uniref:Uncharacterized protein n=1 Tax=Verticillium longisporum TaxID=100787 RepID=A0A0G4LN38_VERLO|nr:hypothetical protein BN1708_003677 [Verticillium longisporum]
MDQCHVWWYNIILRRMDFSNAASSWIGTIATALGLGSLIAQGNVIQERLDPYSPFRGTAVLGIWTSRQASKAWYNLRPPILVGPVITATLTQGFCGLKSVFLSRRPDPSHGTASWAVVMEIFHPQAVDHHFETSSIATLLPVTDGSEGPEDSTYRQITGQDRRSDVVGISKVASTWSNTPTQRLILHRSAACATISRTTLIVMLAMTSAREGFRHVGAAGYRASYPSYGGLWTIEWPIGDLAIVRLSPHDILAAPGSDPYPPLLHVRVDCCVEMMSGILKNRKGLCVAFPGRKSSSAVLRFQKNGYAGAHGSRHLYNMSGGVVYPVDLLARIDTPYPFPTIESEGTVHIEAPSLEQGKSVWILIPPLEREILVQAMDSIPWNTLSWSLHRGMRHIILGFGKPCMDLHRGQLADMLRQTVKQKSKTLMARGWASDMVLHHMPDVVHSTVMAGHGDSGDAVRAVVDTAYLLVHAACNLDETHFWRDADNASSLADGAQEWAVLPLSTDTIVALTKFMVIEWSQEMDYQMYHDLPMTLLIAS